MGIIFYSGMGIKYQNTKGKYSSSQKIPISLLMIMISKPLPVG